MPGEEVVGGLDDDEVGRSPRSSGRCHCLGRAVLVVAGHQQVDGSIVGRSERCALDHGERGSDRDPPSRSRIGDVEAHGRSERVAHHPDRAICHVSCGVDGGDDVEALIDAPGVGAVGRSTTTEVEADRRDSGSGEPVGQAGQQPMMAVAAEERMGVAQHGCATGPGGCGWHGEVGREADPVEGVQVERVRFDRHEHDGTLASVADTEKLPIKMLNDRLLVRIPDKEGERRSSGGILIPATAQVSKRLVWADVVAYGQNVRSVEIGDRVLFSPEDRYEVEVGGDDYIMLRERDIHAVAAKRVEGSTGLYL